MTTQENKLTFGKIAVSFSASIITALLVIYFLKTKVKTIYIPFVDITITQYHIGIGAIILIILFIGSILFKEKILLNILDAHINILFTSIAALAYLILSIVLLTISNELVNEFYYTILIYFFLSTLIVFPINIKLRQLNIGTERYHKILNFILFYSSTVLVTAAFVAPDLQDKIGYLVLILAVPILSNSYYDSFYSKITK